MTQDLSNWVLSHLIEHSVDDDTADLVLAAMDGDSALDEALRGPVQHRSVGDVSEATRAQSVRSSSPYRCRDSAGWARRLGSTSTLLPV